MTGYEQERDRGADAQALLDSPLLNTALDAIEREVIAAWEQCPARDGSGRDQLWMLFKVSKNFRALLLGYVQTGKLAHEQLRVEKFRRFGLF